MKIINKSILFIAICLFLGIASINAQANSNGRCTFELTSTDEGTAIVKVRKKILQIIVKNARPQTLYTVWLDYKSRETGLLADDYPLEAGAIGRGIAPAFKSTAGVTAGMGLDPNSFITNRHGRAKFNVKLDYLILETGASPVVSGELSMQGTNLIGGYWLRQYPVDPNVAPSLQATHPFSGLPLLERSTVQGFTVQFHPDFISHGHTPGTKGVDHFSAFKGDIPAECKED
jgi:hypothetical protein